MNSRVLPFDVKALAAGGHAAAPGGGAGHGGSRRALGGPQRPDEPDRVDVRELFRMLWRRRKLVLGAMLLGMLLAFGAAKTMSVSYTGLAKIMLQNAAPQVTAQGAAAQVTPLNDQLVNSEVAVLQSNVLIQSAIEKVGVAKLDAMDPANRAPSPLARALGAVKGLLGGGAKPAGTGAAGEGLTPAQLKMQRLVWAVRKNLKITREGQSYVIDIKVMNGDPVLAANLANTIADQYIAQQIAARQAAAQNATKFLAERVAELRGQVSAAEDKVEKFRARNLLVDGGTLDAARQQLGELNNQLIAARAAQIAAQARYGRIQQVIKKDGLVAVANIVTSPALDALSSQLMTLQRQDAIWAQHYGPDHPERVRLAGEIKGVKHDLGVEVQKLIDQRRNDADIAAIREETLKGAIQKMETRVVDLSRSTIGLRQLEREASAKRAAYQQLLARLTDTQTQEQMQSPNAKVIERAEIAGTPSWPRPKLLMALGGALGLIFGTAAVFFLELTATTFRTLPELERATGLPVLAAVPQGAWKSPLGAWRELAQSPYGLYAERIRHLRTALLMRDGKEAARSVMLASANAGEGKTTTTLALARMAALAGKRVIVVDCDLRRSMLYRIFGWQAETDFAAFIFNECPLEEAIHHDPDLGFDVLAASKGRPDAADELASDWLEGLFEALKDSYDLVLVDAPALLAVSDALVVGQAVDSSLFLVRWNDTTRAAIAKALSDCDEAGLMIAGTVLTKVDPRMSSDVYVSGYEYSA